MQKAPDFSIAAGRAGQGKQWCMAGTQEGCPYEPPFWMIPQICILLLCSLGLPLLGWLLEVFLWVRGFCQHNWQSTIAANMCLPHIFLSSNRISIFSKVNQTYTHRTAHGPLLTAPLAFHSSQEQRQVSVQCWCSFSSFPHIWLNHLHLPYKKHATSILSSWTAESNSPRQKHPVCSKFEILGS